MRRLALQVCGFGVLVVSTGSAQVTQRVSVDSNGAQGNARCWPVSDVSFDGRYVAFASNSTNLVPGDTNGGADVFVRDRQGGTIERVSIGPGGVEGNGWSDSCSISADGRFVAFESTATNLVVGDTNSVLDVFVRDRQLGTTTRVSVDSSGAAGDIDSFSPSLSADGRYVAFHSYATNLVSGDTNATWDVFVRDRQGGTTERVSVDSGGAEGNSASGDTKASISADGRYVAFQSWATNLVPGDTNGFIDVFVHDRVSGMTERVSVDSGGIEGNGISSNFDRPTLSADGRHVVFSSFATNLVPGDTNGVQDVFVRDRQTSTTERVSVDSGGVPGNNPSGYASISDDGRYVVFFSGATNLVPGDTAGALDIFVHDRQSGMTERMSVDSAGVEGNLNGFDSSEPFPSISGNGRFVAFESWSTNLVPGDTNGWADIFVRDRTGGTSFTSLCNPGFGGVIACPCSNPPSGLGRGCNNSAATGGAILTASGGTFLSSDSLVFTTSGEKPTALSIVTQWTGLNSSGVVFGMGVRCTSGTFKRMYNKSAVGGSITAPNFGAGDLSVSARSAALGNTILPGQSRWYLVYYRDPIVLGGCPASSTFNATQTGVVTWSP